jgi:hypothetical protein
VPPTGHVIGVRPHRAHPRYLEAPAGDEAQLRGVVDVTTASPTSTIPNSSMRRTTHWPMRAPASDRCVAHAVDRHALALVNVGCSSTSYRAFPRARHFKQAGCGASSINISFLTQLWQQGAFGTGKPSEVFTVTCDASNNPPAQVSLGYLNVDITFNPAVPAETIIVRVGQQPGGATASEA